jgi:ferritin-like metal-binding protein YciE
MSLKTLEDLFVHELRDLHSAEKQLIKALPKIAKAATSEKLRRGIEEHLEETRHQEDRLDQILEQLGKSSRGARCEAMEGLIEEGQRMIDEDAEPHVRDAGLISMAQRVEHYEIAGYGTARTYAKLLGHGEAEDLLQQTLDEERAADEKLTELAMSEINVGALQVTG